MDLLVSNDDSVSHGWPVHIWSRELRHASQSSLTDGDFPTRYTSFWTSGRNLADEASCFNEGWKAPNRQQKCVVLCCFLLKHLLMSQGGSAVVSATRRRRNKLQGRRKELRHHKFYPFCISPEGIFDASIHWKTSDRDRSHQEVGPLRWTACPCVWVNSFQSLEVIPHLSSVFAAAHG